MENRKANGGASLKGHGRQKFFVICGEGPAGFPDSVGRAYWAESLAFQISSRAAVAFSFY